MKALSKLSRESDFKEGFPKHNEREGRSKKLGIPISSCAVALSHDVEAFPELSKASDEIFMAGNKPCGQGPLNQPLQSTKYGTTHAARYNFVYKNGSLEIASEDMVSNSPQVKKISAVASGLSKSPCERNCMETSEIANFTPRANSKHPSPSRRSNRSHKISTPTFPSVELSHVGLHKHLEPSQKLSKLEKVAKSNAKGVRISDTAGVHQPHASPGGLTPPRVVSYHGQAVGHVLADADDKVPGKENKDKTLCYNTPRDLSERNNISDASVMNEPQGPVPKRPQKPPTHLKVRDTSSNGRVSISKVNSPFIKADRLGVAGSALDSKGRGKGRENTQSLERQAPASSSPQQAHRKRLPLASVISHNDKGPCRVGRNQSPHVPPSKNRGKVLPPLVMDHQRCDSVASERSASPQLSIMELSSLPQDVVDGHKEVATATFQAAPEAVPLRGHPSPTITSKMERLQQQLQSQDAKMRKLQRKERSWEEQVKQLKIELRNARKKELALYKIAGIDPKHPRRAETAPDPPSGTSKDKCPDGVILPHKLHELQKASPSNGARARVCEKKSDFLKMRIFSQNSFRAITAPDLPYIASEKLHSGGKTRVRPLLNSLVPPSPLEGGSSNTSGRTGRTDLQSVKLASLNTRQTALCLPQETDTAAHPIRIRFEHLLQFVDGQIITQQQAEGLWRLLCSNKKVISEGTVADADKTPFGEMDVLQEMATGSGMEQEAAGSLSSCLEVPSHNFSPLRGDYAMECFESSQPLPVLTKALRRKIEGSQSKSTGPTALKQRGGKDASFMEYTPLHSTSELATKTELSLPLTTHAVSQEVSHDIEVEEGVDVLDASNSEGGLKEARSVLDSAG